MKKILTLVEAEQKFSQENIVFISGSFDILHSGHQFFIKQVRSRISKESKIMIALLSDEEIRRRKGFGRPINNLNERIQALSRLIEVDYIIPWTDNWESLRDFIKINKPMYIALVEGDPGFENKIQIAHSVGSKALIVNRIPGISTTEIIKTGNDENI